MYRVAVITLSDKGARGEREDVSGQVIEDMVKEAGYKVVSRQLLSDDRQGLTDALISLCDSNTAELILTTGGTGFSPRDNAPPVNAWRPVLPKPCAWPACKSRRVPCSPVRSAASAKRR